MSLLFTDAEIKILQSEVQGTFHHEEGDLMVFGSHTFPSYRITCSKKQAREKLDERFEEIRDQAQRD